MNSIKVKLNEYTLEMFNPESETYVDLDDCIELEDGTLLDPNGFILEVVN